MGTCPFGICHTSSMFIYDQKIGYKLFGQFGTFPRKTTRHLMDFIKKELFSLKFLIRILWHIDNCGRI